MFSHHGIDCGDGTVIDFAGRGGGKNTAIIRRIKLAEFSQGAPVRTRSYGMCHNPEIVVARAASMIGRSGYDLFSNNCEHFATWCVTGEHCSAQVEAVWAGAGMVGVGNVAPRIGRGAVVGSGETAPRSASNVMSGLTKRDRGRDGRGWRGCRGWCWNDDVRATRQAVSDRSRAHCTSRRASRWII